MSLVDSPDNPLPAPPLTGYLRSRDGTRLRYARFLAGTRPHRGTVVILQGRAEFIEKYFETVRDLGSRGFAAALLDFRGQGASQRRLRNRRKGHVDDFAEYVEDVETLMREVVLPDCPPPFYLLAHSMGGTVALDLLQRRPLWFERAVLSAPLFGLPLGPREEAIRGLASVLDALGLGAAFVPGGRSKVISLAPFEGNPLTSDPVRYRRTGSLIEAHPEFALGSPTVGWVDAAFRAMRRSLAPAYLASIRVPVLAVAAGTELVVSNAAIEAFGRMSRLGGVVTVPNARHELLMERDCFRDLFWAAFDAFVPGTPRGA